MKMIDATYGHLVADAEAFERDLLDAWDARRLAQARRGVAYPRLKVLRSARCVLRLS